jgi:ubiquinone/menaquinone biosynthesis C-methylase UbiE
LSDYEERYVRWIVGWPADNPPKSADFLLKHLQMNESHFEMLPFLKRLIEVKNRPVHWLDVPGGYGIALRGLALAIAQDSTLKKEQFQLTSVDLIDWYKTGSPESLEEIRERHGASILSEQYAPHFIQGDALTVKVNAPFDFMTMFEGIQYMKDKLGTLVNLYNQAADGAFLVIGTLHEWPRAIKTFAHPSIEYDPLFDDWIRELIAAVSLSATPSKNHRAHFGPRRPSLPR